MRSRQLTIDNVRAAITRGDYHQALQLIISTMDDWVQDHHNTLNLIYGCTEFDHLCLEIGKRIASLPAPELNISTSKVDERPLDLYLTTMIYWAGGHTPVIGDFVRSNPNHRAALVVTGVLHKEIKIPEKTLQRTTITEKDVYIVNAPDYQHQTQKLIQLIRQLQPDRIFLFNHHFDAVLIAAAQPQLARKTFYYHHCDHNPALGLYLPHAVHLDLNPNTFRRCRELLGIDAVYVPLAMDDRGARDNDSLGQNDSLVTCSSGASSKFDPHYKYPYQKMVPEILARTGGKHVHIGPMDDAVMSELQQGLCQARISADRFIHSPWEASIWEAMAKYRVDLYLNSFPQGGARASVEVMGSGTPLLWHALQEGDATIESPLKYPAGLQWRTPEELYQILSSASPEWLRLQGQSARQHYERVHQMELFKKGLAQDFVNNPPPSSANGNPNMADYQRLLELVHRLNDRKELAYDHLSRFQNEQKAAPE